MPWQKLAALLVLTRAFYVQGMDQSLAISNTGPQTQTIKGLNTTSKVEESLLLDFQTPTNPGLQRELETIDARLRAADSIQSTQVAVGVLDLVNGRLAMIHPDQMEYAASVAKLGILLAYFELKTGAAGQIDPDTRHELGLMAKNSSNEMASKFSHLLGLKEIQSVLNRYGFYDKEHGGGIWMGKHYGQDVERIGDPIGNNSHAVTVRQLLRFYLLLDQKKLVSAAASRAMLDVMASPELPHDDIKFVRGLKGREVTIFRKWGSWENWLHDSAIISGSNRRYILVGLTHHPKGDEYLVKLASAIDDFMIAAANKR